MGNVDIPDWLKGLPSAPVFRPTDTEFADPIAYISKIEKEASAFGICKIVPPFPKPSKKYVFSNLNKSLLKSPELGSNVEFGKIGDGNCGNDGELKAIFTTRQQELGLTVKRARGAENVGNPQLGNSKQVWQSGEVYTLEQFESKSKAFSRSQLGMIKELSPLVVEASFWKTASQKPIYIEYANDVPGSGFGEPQGHFRDLHRRRRKRGLYQRRRESFVIKENEMTDPGSAKDVNKIKDLHSRNDISTSPEAPKPSSTLSTLPIDKDLQPCEQKSVDCGSDMEGTAGWKLSNSPWNLQRIARSPGSLTRFMPDDIPGVTSPMVYIGMLFSWFAWHVEDHELHSMNFLHTGSAKTWYSVPGDHALEFEEVIRSKAYGGNIDQLAALALLGEKTTLVSPEIIVASGIPCCRLVQNPGEFVVTFPRAYHVGFSHGFNCGEAANFGTSGWLKVAKEAAVRRATMNYLPMLSHQQLLYLLTMSFVSRVPRSLLPGARSSRLRDRQREEREFLVKKAFIEDMLNENKTLSLLLGRDSSYRAVVWDPDLLPHHAKQSQVADASGISSPPPENVVHDHSEDNNGKKRSLLEEMSLFMENLNDLYLDDDDDLLSDFQVDTGTLTCVACGILGFPFMTVVQPSEKESTDFPEKRVASGISETSFSRMEMPTTSSKEFENGWNTSNRTLRPRILCLEHAVEVQKLLQPKDAVNVLVICHKDFQKIKVHATTVAEEIGIPFSYNEVPLDIASQEDLCLIDLAIDDEENNENGEDWTSKLGINLRHCVKVRKNSPTKQIQHALSFCGLFPDKNPSVELSDIKWQFKKSRSKHKPGNSFLDKPCDNIEIKAEETTGGKVDCVAISGEKEKIIRYTRRKKPKQDCSAECSLKVATAVKYGDLDNLLGHIENQNSDAVIAGTELSDLPSDNQSQLKVESSISNEEEHVSETSKVTDGSCHVIDKDVTNDSIMADEASDGTDCKNELWQENISAWRSDEPDLSGGAISTPPVPNFIEEDSPRQIYAEGSFHGEKLCSDMTSASGDLCNKTNLYAEEQKEIQTAEKTGSDELARDSIQILAFANKTLGNKQSLNLSDRDQLDKSGGENLSISGENCSLQGSMSSENTKSVKDSRKLKSSRETEFRSESKLESHSSYMRSPCEGLRPRVRKETTRESTFEMTEQPSKKSASEKPKKPSIGSLDHHRCTLEGCKMSFETKKELQTHKRNRCTHEGCGKKFRAHKYVVLHQRVHNDDRPFKCTWKECTMTFKWAWARTEHLRLHTGERPYECKVEGCGLSFRFVSDFSRHRRKTGHYVN